MTWHLAIIPHHCLDNVLSGVKTADGRFARVRCAPHGRVKPGDHVFLKELGGPIRGCARVDRVVAFENMVEGEAVSIVEQYRDELKVGCDYLTGRTDARFATLVFYSDVVACQPLEVENFGRAGWVVLDELQLPEDEYEPALAILAREKGKL